MSVNTANRVYFELVEQFPLRPIRNERELDRAINMIDSLLDRRRLNNAEQDYLDVLTDLVEKYESEAHPIAPVGDAEILAHLLEARGLSQTALAEATGIVNSTLSAVLHGKRRLSRDHIGRLAQFFHVSPTVFQFGNGSDSKE
ncbi:MAG TPA: helix-turn-helix domain-containing protein [Pirellulales bacterium]|nr:helix-turn-helix domain-containing protein [Pirellulales bacterium]